VQADVWLGATKTEISAAQWAVWLVKYCTFTFLLVVPEISETLLVSNVTQTGVHLSWSIGKTQHIDLIQIYQRQLASSGSAAEPWSAAQNTSDISSHTVTSLTPGTAYEFYVVVESYGNINQTDAVTVTTGMLTVTVILV